jgi:hypothetical protein
MFNAVACTALAGCMPRDTWTGQKLAMPLGAEAGNTFRAHREKHKLLAKLQGTQTGTSKL